MFRSHRQSRCILSPPRLQERDARLNWLPVAVERKTAPFWENFRPHLIPTGTEDYLGVTVVDLPQK